MPEGRSEVDLKTNSLSEALNMVDSVYYVATVQNGSIHLSSGIRQEGFSENKHVLVYLKPGTNFIIIFSPSMVEEFIQKAMPIVNHLPRRQRLKRINQLLLESMEQSRKCELWFSAAVDIMEKDEELLRLMRMMASFKGERRRRFQLK